MATFMKKQKQNEFIFPRIQIQYKLKTSPMYAIPDSELNLIVVPLYTL